MIDSPKAVFCLLVLYDGYTRNEIDRPRGGTIFGRVPGQILAAFGYPDADPHDCERAALAALAVTAAALGPGAARARAGLAKGGVAVRPPREADADVAGPAVAEALATAAAAPPGAVMAAGSAASRLAGRFLLDADGKAAWRVDQRRSAYMTGFIWFLSVCRMASGLGAAGRRRGHGRFRSRQYRSYKA